MTREASLPLGLWRLGTRVRKIKGASWQGRVVGYYSTTLTPQGYCVESERESGSVQIYPAAALELIVT
jgi:dihydrofolate reductase (trimethoprim resistance protein)